MSSQGRKQRKHGFSALRARDFLTREGVVFVTSPRISISFSLSSYSSLSLSRALSPPRRILIARSHTTASYARNRSHLNLCHYIPHVRSRVAPSRRDLCAREGRRRPGETRVHSRRKTPARTMDDGVSRTDIARLMACETLHFRSGMANYGGLMQEAICCVVT